MLQANVALGSKKWSSEDKGEGTVAYLPASKTRSVDKSANNWSFIHLLNCHCPPTMYLVMDSIHTQCSGGTILLTYLLALS